MEAVGANGRMILDEAKLTISRKGTGLLTAMNLGLQGGHGGKPKRPLQLTPTS